MNEKLERWNNLSADQAAAEILSCCGSNAWARGVASRRPLVHERALLTASDETWNGLSETDWDEAFRSHPRIGESKSQHATGAQAKSWSTEEQQGVAVALETAKNALAEANREYEQRFHRIFIVCATGKTAPEILQIIRRRMENDDGTEFREAAEQQRLITHLRLRKWLWD
jgi:2-oxo-4-hydroxy-4-carboxy-5-ureidoimidazoline decarboxylase